MRHFAADHDQVVDFKESAQAETREEHEVVGAVAGTCDVAAETAQSVERPFVVHLEIPTQVQAVIENRRTADENRSELGFDRNRIVDLVDETMMNDLLARCTQKRETRVETDDG